MAEKEIINGTTSIKNKNFGRDYASTGKYTGEMRKIAFLMQPYGKGEAVYTGKDGDIVQEGYWKKGEFIEGTMTTATSTMKGVFENDFMIKGILNLQNGDFVQGTFGTMPSVDEFHLTDKFGTVIKGKVLSRTQITLQNGARRNDSAIISGTIIEKNGSAYIGVFKVADLGDCTKTGIEKKFTSHEFKPEQLYGLAKIKTSDGQTFFGARVNLNFDMLDKVDPKLLERIEKILPNLERQKKDLRFNETTSLKQPAGTTLTEICKLPANYYGFAYYNSGDINYRLNGYFDFDMKPGNLSDSLKYRFTKGTIKARTDIGIFEGGNDKFTEKKANIDKKTYAKLVDGVFVDDKNSITYKGNFSLEQLAHDFNMPSAIREQLRFRSGVISVKMPNRTDKFLLNESHNTVNPCEDLHGVRVMGENNYKKYGDFKKGSFSIDLTKGEPIASKFLFGKQHITVDTREKDGKITVYNLQNYESSEKDRAHYTFENFKDISKNATYFGTISQKFEEGNTAGEYFLKGVFSGDFIKKNFALIEGDISNTKSIKFDDGTNTCYSLKLQKQYDDHKFPMYFGVQKALNLVQDGDKIDSVSRIGNFLYDDTTRKAELISGDFHKSAPDRSYLLRTQDGTIYDGKIALNSEKSSLVRSGRFVLENDTYKMQKGDIEYSNGPFVYLAEYDAEGLKHFSGKLFAGTLLDTRNDSERIITTDSLLKLDRMLENQQRVNNKNTSFAR